MKKKTKPFDWIFLVFVIIGVGAGALIGRYTSPPIIQKGEIECYRDGSFEVRNFTLIDPDMDMSYYRLAKAIKSYCGWRA